MYFIFHVTTQDNRIDVSYKFMGGSFSHYVTTLKSLVAIGILIIKTEKGTKS